MGTRTMAAKRREERTRRRVSMDWQASFTIRTFAVLASMASMLMIIQSCIN